MGTRDRRIADLERRERELIELLKRCLPRERLFVLSDLEYVRERLAIRRQKGRAA